MTQKTSFAGRIAITTGRAIGALGLTLGLLLGALDVPRPAVAQPISFGDAKLLTPATSENFTMAGFRGHRGVRHGFSKGGHGFKRYRFGSHRFVKRRFYGHGFKGHRFGGHGLRKRHYYEHRFRGKGYGKYGFKRYY